MLASEPASHFWQEATAPVPGHVHLELARLCRENGHLPDAIRACARAARHGPLMAEALLETARSLRALGDRLECIAALKAALHLRPPPALELTLYFELGLVHDENDPAEAAYYYRRVVARDRRHRDVAGRLLAAIERVESRPSAR